MPRYTRFLLSMAGYSASLLAQQPSISYRGIVNAASLTPQGLPSGAIARGSIFTIFGRALGPTTPTAAAGFPLQTSLGGVSVRVFQGNTSVNAIPLLVSASEISAVMPSSAPLGLASVQVTFNNARSNAAPLRVVESSFGAFAANGVGQGPGVLQNFIAQNQQPFNNLLASATPGQTVTLWGTGLGAISGPDNVAPPPGNLPTKVEVFVGGKQASVQYSGRSPCCSGVDQIVFQVPSDAPTGCWVPVDVRTGGSVTSNSVTLAISSGGSRCSEPANVLVQVFVDGGRLALLTLIRGATHQDVAVAAPIDVTSDFIVYNTLQERGGPFAFGASFSLPPPGTCTTYNGSGDFFADGALPGPIMTLRALDAGKQFSLTGPKGTANVTRTFDASFLGSFLPLYSLPNQLYLDPGNYTLAGSGGADIGAFQAKVTIPSPFTWTNRDQITTVDRTKGLTVTWSGAASGQTMSIFGGNADLPSNSTALFHCVVPPGATSFTVPDYVLAVMPPTRYNMLQSKGVIYLSNLSVTNAASFSAPGLDAGAIQAVYLSGKTVIFQ